MARRHEAIAHGPKLWILSETPLLTGLAELLSFSTARGEPTALGRIQHGRDQTFNRGQLGLLRNVYLLE